MNRKKNKWAQCRKASWVTRVSYRVRHAALWLADSGQRCGSIHVGKKGEESWNSKQMVVLAPVLRWNLFGAVFHMYKTVKTFMCQKNKHLRFNPPLTASLSYSNRLLMWSWESAFRLLMLSHASYRSCVKFITLQITDGAALFMSIFAQWPNQF